MVQSSLPPDWLNRFSDPYAVLGVSVVADDRRILIRYRAVAKVLHPDSQASADDATRDFAGQLFARLVNPSYQKLKQDKGRAENLALLRLKTRKLVRENRLSPSTELARKLLQHPVSEVDVFYEQAIATLAESQYQPIEKFEPITEELSELNLVYFQLKMKEVFVSEKRIGVVPASEAQPIQFSPPSVSAEKVSESYAQRHYRRAQEYMKKENWFQAVQELRDAIKIEADKSEYHSLLGIAYLRQKLPGMAKVYFRQALKLDPTDKLANQYAVKLDIHTNRAEQNGKTIRHGGFFGFFRAKKKP